MSIKYMTMVWECGRWSGSDLLMMLALADFANDNGYCWPSVPTLAEKCRVSERHVKRILHTLIDEPMPCIEQVRMGNGAGHSSMYRLIEENMKNSDAHVTLLDEETVTPTSPFYDERVTSEAKRVTSEAKKGDAHVTRSVIEPSKEREKPRPLNGAASVRQQAPVVAQRVEARKFVNGRIPAGKGTTPVEVYYERHSIRDDDTRLTAPLEDDITAAVSDLAKWRQTVTAWQQAGYRAKNIAGQLEWYRNGVPTHKGQNGATGPPAVASAWEALAQQDEPEYIKQMKRAKPT